MSGHDSHFKELLQEFFAEFLRLTVPEIVDALDADSAQPISPELFTDYPDPSHRWVDVAWKVPTRWGGPDRVVVHVEIEREARRNMEQRMLEYAVLLRAREGVPVVPIVVFLKGGPPGVGRRTATERVGGMTVLRADYTAFSLSRSKAEEHLAGSNRLGWALAALMSTDLRPSEHRLRCMAAITGAEVSERREFLLFNTVRSYLELEGDELMRYQERIARDDMAEVAKMEMTWAERTKLAGFEEGELHEGRRLLLRLLEARFGPLPDASRFRVETLGTTEEIEGLVERAATAGSLDELEL